MGMIQGCAQAIAELVAHADEVCNFVAAPEPSTALQSWWHMLMRSTTLWQHQSRPQPAAPAALMLANSRVPCLPV
jgi:hypothetical protein